MKDLQPCFIMLLALGVNLAQNVSNFPNTGLRFYWHCWESLWIWTALDQTIFKSNEVNCGLQFDDHELFNWLRLHHFCCKYLSQHLQRKVWMGHERKNLHFDRVDTVPASWLVSITEVACSIFWICKCVHVGCLWDRALLHFLRTFGDFWQANHCVVDKVACFPKVRQIFIYWNI